MESLNQLLFISTSIVKYKALAWPPTWHLQHSRETNKKSVYSHRMEQVWELQTDTKNSPQNSTWQKEVWVRSGQRACLGEWKMMRRLTSFLCSRRKNVQGRKEAKVCGLCEFVPLTSCCLYWFPAILLFGLWVLMERREGWHLNWEQGVQRAGTLLWHPGGPSCPQRQSSAIGDCRILEYLLHLHLGPTNRSLSAPECKGRKRHIPKIKDPCANLTENWLI